MNTPKTFSFAVLALVYSAIEMGTARADEAVDRSSKNLHASIALLAAERHRFDFIDEPVNDAIEYVHLLFVERMAQIAESGVFPAARARSWGLFAYQYDDKKVNYVSADASLGEALSKIAKTGGFRFVLDEGGIATIPVTLSLDMDKYKSPYASVFLAKFEGDK